MLKRLTLAAVCVALAGAGPATRPAKPATYAELKAENEQLKASIERLEKTIAELRAALAAVDAPAAPVADGPQPPTVLKIGMTMAEVQAISKRDKTQLVKLQTIPDAEGDREIWRESRSFLTTNVPLGEERRSTAGIPVQKQEVWGRVLRFKSGALTEVGKVFTAN